MIHFEQTITIKRPNLYAYKEAYGVVGSIMGIILPVKAEDMMLTEGDPSKQFKLYCDITEDLKEADKVICEGEEYMVKTVRKFKLRGLERLEAFIYRPNN